MENRQGNQPAYRIISLYDLPVGRSAIVNSIQAEGISRRRMLDLGLVPGTRVEALRVSPAGDPKAYRIRGAVIAFRKEEAHQILVNLTERGHTKQRTGTHLLKHGHPFVDRNVPDGMSPMKYVVALAGNPNTGKSTVFNALTGLNQHTGNWPGKTVIRTEGRYIHHGLVYRLIDLPGTYSLMANSVEEQVARDYLCFGRPDATIVVLDATCLERNLNLALQVLEITSRVVVCVNLVDEAARKKIQIDYHALAAELGVPVVPTAARDGVGLDKLVDTVSGIATGRIETRPCVVRYKEEIENAVRKLEPKFKKLVGDAFNARWLAIRILDKDQAAIAAVEQWLARKDGLASRMGGVVWA